MIWDISGSTAPVQLVKSISSPLLAGVAHTSMLYSGRCKHQEHADMELRHLKIQ